MVAILDNWWSQQTQSKECDWPHRLIGPNLASFSSVVLKKILKNFQNQKPCTAILYVGQGHNTSLNM
jgi:hypothetical protein